MRWLEHNATGTTSAESIQQAASEPSAWISVPLSSPEVLLLTVAAIIVAGVMGEYFFRRTGIPDVAFLMMLGVLVGPMMGIIGIDVVTQVVPYFAALALLIIMFDGGLNLRIDSLVSSAHFSFILAILGFAASTILAALVAVFGLGWDWTSGALLGVMVGGSSSIIVFGLIRRLKLSESTKSMLGLESAVTDILATLGAFVIFGIVTSGTVDPSAIVSMTQTSILVGVGLGVGAGIPWIYVQSKLGGSKHAYMLTLASLFSLFFVARMLGESGALTALVYGLTIGNREIISRYLRIPPMELSTPVNGSTSNNPFHDQVTFLVRTFFFVFIGLMANFNQPLYMIFGTLIGVVLYVARVQVVRVTIRAGSIIARVAKSKLAPRFSDIFVDAIPPSEINVVRAMMPRGLAAAVLATIPLTLGLPNAEVYPQLVFYVIISSVVITTIGLAGSMRKLKLAQNSGSVDEESAAEKSEFSSVDLKKDQ